MPLTIYHNPRCSKSRQTLELIQQAGVDPSVVLYLENPPTAERILELAGLIGVPVIDIARRNEEAFRTADDLPDTDDDTALAAWIAKHPKVLERPIVVDDDRRVAVVGRPPDNVQVLLGQ
tara:strand:- start:1526 stop:1885 length:360 start_codon:yes stop_codon:yes gene_type:complete